MQKQESIYPCIYFPYLSFGKYLSVLSALKEIMICRMFLGLGNFGKWQKQQKSETSVSECLSFLKKYFGSTCAGFKRNL